MVRRANQPIQTKQNNSSPDNHTKLTFLEHFYELRKRLFWIALTLAITTSVGLEIKDWLIAVIVAPLKGAQLIYLTPGGGFSFIFTLSLYFGVLLTIPVITYHIYRFLQPMLKTTSRRFVLMFVGISTGLAFLGAGLSYFLAIPSALGFLNDVSGNSIIPNLTADSYLRFVVTYTVGLAVLFQLPLLIFLFDHIRPIPPGILKRTQRYGIVAAAVLAGFMTPSPDLMNYAIVLLPIIGVYEIGVLAVYLRRRLLRDRKQVKMLPAVQQSEALIPAPAYEALDGSLVEAPLTAIVEEIASETEPAEEHLPAVQQAVAETEVTLEAPREMALEQAEAHHATAGLVSESEPIRRPISDIQPMDHKQAPVVAQPTARVLPAKSRSIDGVHRMPARYKTNVQVPTRQAVSVPKILPKKSLDGFLTA